MLIALDIGNSHITFGGFDGDELVFVASIATDERQTGEQYACTLRDVFSLHNIAPEQVTGVAMCSVVPAATQTLQAAFRLLCDCPILCIGQGIRTGLHVRVEQPRALGSDLVAGAVCALAQGKLPCVVVDLGTATTFTVLDHAGTLIGYAITAGLSIALSALKQRAALLPTVQPIRPARVIGRSTMEAMQSGSVYGTAALVDGMLLRIADELNQSPTVYITGGAADLIAPLLRTPHTALPYAGLHGLRIIWQKNQA